jgi:hypothetical protein
LIFAVRDPSSMPRHIYQFDRVRLYLQMFANETVPVGSNGLKSKIPANQFIAQRAFVVARLLHSLPAALSSLICCVILACND